MISVYIHIPFCSNICTYCDFCKLYKNDEWIDKYLGALFLEIKKYYHGEKVKTLYFGGGTPSSLNINQLVKLFDIVKVFDLSDDAEITFECNVEDLTLEKLEFLKNKVNRLSIGVQSFNSDILNLLGRKDIRTNNIKLAKKYFDNINIDLMYGFDGITLDDFKKDIDAFLELDVPHLSAYNLILEQHTKLYIDNYKVNEDDEFDKFIENILKENGYNHYEISNYAKDGYESRHNLTYWNNEHYYGFGLGASGYIGNIRYENTKSLNKYLNGEYRFLKNTLDKNETMQNEFILGFRKINGINKDNFKNKYGIDIKDIKVVQDLLSKDLLLENDKNIYVNPKYICVSNEILIKFLENLYQNISL